MALCCGRVYTSGCNVWNAASVQETIGQQYGRVHVWSAGGGFKLFLLHSAAIRGNFCVAAKDYFGSYNVSRSTCEHHLLGLLDAQDFPLLSHPRKNSESRSVYLLPV